jgi:hypothetical protein
MANGFVWMVRFSNGRFVLSDDLDDEDKEPKLKSNAQTMSTGSALCRWMGQDDAMRSACELIQRMASKMAAGIRRSHHRCTQICRPCRGRFRP